MTYEDDGPLATMADVANDYHMRGLQCPFDCSRCQPPEPDIVGEWVLTFADGCVGEDYRYADAPNNNQPVGGYCHHGWQPVTKAVEFLGLPYVRIPDPPPYDPWTDTCPF